MKVPPPEWMSRVGRRLRGAERTPPTDGQPIAGQFQTYRHTLPDRYPWLFRFAAAQLDVKVGVRLLSFGCSTGEEVWSLRQYFPRSRIRGIDVDPQNVAVCRSRASRQRLKDLTFGVGASTAAEASDSYDAIFCLAVLCLGDLTASGAEHCDPRLTFSSFELLMTDFTRCLKPSGLLLLHTTNFRFCDTQVAARFDTLLEAREEQMAPDLQYGRDNRRLTGPRYRGVAFRKRA